MIFGYARVSTDEQVLGAQLDALHETGVQRVFQGKKTGKSKERVELSKLLKKLRPEDVAIVTKYDRLARSLRDLIEIVDQIREKGAGFRSLREDIDTTKPAGRLVLHVCGSIAEFERERIVERTLEGLSAARKRGRIGGRRPALNAEQKDAVRRMREQYKRPLGELARLFNVSKQTISRA